MPRKQHAFAAEIPVFAIETAYEVILLVASLRLFLNDNGFVVTEM
jgi:hypothetical protein